MIFAISPNHTTIEFPNGPESIDQKVEIFVDRVNGWQLGVAEEMISKGIAHCNLALLSIIMNYFEMMAKYQHKPDDPPRYDKKGRLIEPGSGEYFKLGVKYVIGDIPEGDTAIVSMLWERVRNGLYHTGSILPGIIISDSMVPGESVLGHNEEPPMLVISPVKLIRHLRGHFDDFSAKLRDPNYVELRRRFEMRFDRDNSQVL